jgi:gluconolactonase
MADERVLADGLRFPEGPVVMPDGSVILVEIAAGKITKVAPDGTKSVLADRCDGPNGLAMGPNGLLYLCNNGGFAWKEDDGILHTAGQAEDYSGGRIETFDPATGTLRRLYDRCGEHRLCGPNDIVFDLPDCGWEPGFWFSDLGKSRPRDRDHGGAYWAAADGSRIVEAVHPVAGGANGIGLSPDNRTLYVAETETARLWAWDIVGPGELRKEKWPSPHGGRLLCTMPGYARFDSLAVTASGNICVATLITGEITTISPKGEILDRRRFDDPMVTNICFGGPELRTAYVTLSGIGQLVELPWPEPGLRLAYS